MHGDEGCVRDRELILHTSNNTYDVRILYLPTATRDGCHRSRTYGSDRIGWVQRQVGALGAPDVRGTKKKCRNK